MGYKDKKILSFRGSPTCDGKGSLYFVYDFLFLLLLLFVYENMTLLFKRKKKRSDSVHRGLPQTQTQSTKDRKDFSTKKR